MSFTYDFNSAPTVSKVRLLIADTDSTEPIFQDEEINAAAEIESGTFISGSFYSGGAGVFSLPNPPLSIRRIAATCLDALAANKARLAGVLKVLDVNLGVDKASQELRATAKSLRDTEADSAAFAIAEQVVDDFSMRERVRNQWLRLFGAN